MWLLCVFGTVMAAAGISVLGMAYRYRDRGDLLTAVSHGVVLFVVGALFISSALLSSHRAVLIACGGALLLADALVLTVASRRNRAS